ncbi:hypothetical protein I553_10242 [Mycobacterium xenopi 4042]|uniref:Uncharacterized protein n=1 Tax=Mycobacterium xenopi 4042 TaxID=1299334 RepID=X8AND3_MYCXE|nr:hypothetical protein I553_10242 [Mycobacterium xenopi 4042]EUA34765.1 hypothetical protein I552_5554 [Mycobacterium xenopi 3993]
MTSAGHRATPSRQRHRRTSCPLGPRCCPAYPQPLWVRAHSASGRGRSRQIPFAPQHGLTLTGLHHLELLNHPQIYAKLRDWLTEA